MWRGLGHGHTSYKPSSDSTKSRNVPLLEEFYKNSAHFWWHINTVVENVDCHYALACVKLRSKIEAQHTNPVLSANPCHLPGVAMHWNSRPNPEEYHTDGDSLVAGWDVVTSVGNFDEAWFLVPELRIRIRLGPGDVLLLKGKLFSHKICHEWIGNGRFTFVPWTDSSLFAAYAERRPKACRPFFGNAWRNIREKYPATALSKFIYAQECGEKVLVKESSNVLSEE